MKILADKILRVYETNSPDSKNELGEAYFDLRESAVMQQSKVMKDFFPAPVPVANHSLALKWFQLAENEKPSSLSLKGKLALGLNAYYAAKEATTSPEKCEFYQKASAYLTAVENACPGILPGVICGNLGMWFFTNKQFEVARYWLYKMKEAHHEKPFVNNSQYCVMQNARAATIVNDLDNFEHFCGGMLQKKVPFSKDTFEKYLNILMCKNAFEQSELEMLEWAYNSCEISADTKKQLASILARHYCDEQNWGAAIYWADKNGEKWLRRSIYWALDCSESKWKVLLMSKFQLAAGIVLFLVGALFTFGLKQDTNPQSGIIPLGAFIVGVTGFVIHYLWTQRHFAFLVGLCQFCAGLGLLFFLRPVAQIDATWGPCLAFVVFSASYFMLLLSMPEMFEFANNSFRTVRNLFHPRWR